MQPRIDYYNASPSATKALYALKDARALGESEQRLYALNAWRETPFFSEQERAALEWTEAVTNVQ